jgi:hypothetical protein|tara:strand:- start:1630 stop:2409 length:780 start_codon:yes stop_codon:yes gene_type:complete
MSYQATAHKYNQRGEIFIPNRTGTTYNIPSNHKNFIVYTGLDTDIEFFVIGSDRKPVDASNITMLASIVHRTSRIMVLHKTLQIINYEEGRALLKLTAAETSLLGAALYDMMITFTDASGRTFSMQSDQNNRIGYVLETKLNPAAGKRTSVTSSIFYDEPEGYQGEKLASTTQSFNIIGAQSMSVETTNYTGVLEVQASLVASPGINDWLNIPNISDSLTAYTGTTYFSWTGTHVWVRLIHTPVSPLENNIVDKLTYLN